MFRRGISSNAFAGESTLHELRGIRRSKLPKILSSRGSYPIKIHWSRRLPLTGLRVLPKIVSS